MLARTARQVALIAAFAVPASGAEVAQTVALHGRTMGTTYNVRYWTLDPLAPTPADAQRLIDALLADFDKLFSTWRPDSELSRFNSASAHEWFAVSPAVAIVTTRALKLHKLTDGALDVTVSPLSTLWGFGPNADKRTRSGAAPSDDQIAAALPRVGSRHLQARLDPPALRKNIAELEIDLACIAAGYAVDLLADALAEAHIRNAFVEIGGEVRTVGVRADGTLWRIGVQTPSSEAPTIACTLSLSNQGLATSGDFHNARVIDEVLYAHIIDPRTGRPLRRRGMSITVVAETGFAADGIATALCVMDGDEAYDWCVDHKVAALFQESPRNGEPRLRATPAMQVIAPSLLQRTTAE